MRKLLKMAFVIVIGASLVACAPIKLRPDNKPVQIILSDNEFESVLEGGCEYRGVLISSYGTWYNYLFISNTELTSRALDDMYNKANEVGANTVYLKNIDFTTSVTYIGEAYNCKTQ